jgi:ATP/ADP translocase
MIKLKPGEWKLVLPLLLLLAINTMVTELVAVIATSGFVSNVGSAQVPWLWIADMVALLLFSVGYALMIDRMKRVQLLSWLLGAFAVLYLIIQLLFTYGAPDWLNYLLLYIFADQQFFIFLLAFWALANDNYRIAEAKRLFPVLGAGYAVGSIAGNGLAAASADILARQGGQAYQLLSLVAVLLLIGLVLLYFTFRNRQLRARQSKEKDIDVRETLEVGLDFVKNVPLFRYLGIVMLLAYVSYTVVQYHFLFVLDQTFTSDLQFQSFYGTYKVALIVAILVFQGLITGRLLEKIGLKSSFVAFPIVLLIAAASALAFLGLIGGAVGFFLIFLIERAWDEPVRKSLQGLIPDERRGRISAFLDNYLYALATIIACCILLLLFWTTSLAQLPQQGLVAIYLVVAGLAAAGAVWAAVQVRSVYDQSMLNWRLQRRQRRGLTGVIKKLDL